MIGAAIGAGLKIGGSIFGGIKMLKAIKKMKAQINNQLKDNQNWYDRRYNEDATRRADAQALLTRTEESIRNRNAVAAGAQAVMGGTEESVAAAKEANNKALSDAVTNIAVNADARKDQIEQQYMNKKGELQDKLNNLTMQGAQNTAQAVNGVASVGNDIAGILDK